MKSRKRFWLSILGAIIIFSLLAYGSNPLRWPTDAIYWWLLNKVPMGSEFYQLEAVAKSKGWKIMGTWEGYRPHSNWGGIDGHRVAWVYLGNYRIFFRVDLDSFWAFDEQGHLVGVHIRRMIDAP